MVNRESNVEIAGISDLRSISDSLYTLDGESSLSAISKKEVKVTTVTAPRDLYRVIFNDVDATPDPISDPNFVTLDDNMPHAAYDVRLRAKSEAAIRELKSKTSRIGQNGEGIKVYATTINLDDIQIDHTLNTEEGIENTDGDLSIAPSAFYLPKMYPVTSYPPEITITLKETGTVYLFALPSISYEKGTAEGSIVEEENTYYEYITVGKGRNRKMVTQETQTIATIKQTRHTLATKPDKRNAMSFASVWDMHDTYSSIARMERAEVEDEMVMYQSAARELLRKKKKKFQDLYQGKTFEEIGATPQFFDAVLLTERVLSSLEYDSAQKTFRGLVATDPLSLDLVYIYTLTPLWTYECEETLNKPISGISFNPKCQDICAIGYGKFGYADFCKGIVCIWCTKNPRKPERLYRFEDSVTSVSFSQKNPNWLACGFCNGDVIILDITSYTVKTIARSKRDTNPCFEPIWVITWRAIEKENYVITTCQDGRIRKLQNTKTHDFISSPMMRVSTVEGKLRGLEVPKTCLKVDVPITRYPAVLCMIWHPTIDHCYLVGTDEGCIHRCSTHYLNQHMDVYRAHAGSVTDMCISPFMNYLLASCGSDHAIRFWIDGMDDVIMTLNCPIAVNSITFSPINSTILLSTSGNVLSIWDLRRKIHMPCAEYTFPNNVTLTFIKFEESGQNIYVGDTLGKLHTFHLQDTPLAPFDQAKILNDAIRSALCTKPDLLKQLDKLLLLRERVRVQTPNKL